MKKGQVLDIISVIFSASQLKPLFIKFLFLFLDTDYIRVQRVRYLRDI